MFAHLSIGLVMCRDQLCGKGLPCDGLTVKQKPVKSNVPIYRICLNIARRGFETSSAGRQQWLKEEEEEEEEESNGKPSVAPTSPITIITRARTVILSLLSSTG